MATQTLDKDSRPSTRTMEPRDRRLRPGGLDHSSKPHYRIQYDTFRIDNFHEIQAALRRRERIPRPCHRCL